MRESQKLLSYGFRYFETQKLYDADVALKSLPVYYGIAEEVALGLPEPVSVTIPRGSYDDLVAELEVPVYLEAPLAAGQEVGELVLKLHGETVHRAPLAVMEAVEEAGSLARFADWVVLFFRDLIGSE